MKRWCLTVAACALAAAPLGWQAMAQIATSDVAFPWGSTGTDISGTISGDQIRDYVVRAQAGQVMSVRMTGSDIVFFNVLPPGSDAEAIFIGSTEGDSFSGTLSQSGPYKIRVYQMRSSARRGESGSYGLAVSVTGDAHAGHGSPASHRGSIVGIKGMDGVAAFDELTARGFRNVDSFSSGDTLYGIYYFPASGLCIQTTSADGRIVDIRDIETHPACR
jgi:hypothetical protein